MTRKILQSLILCAVLSGCAMMGGTDVEHQYPKSAEDREVEKIGRLTGEDGFIVSGSKKSSSASAINVNSYLWRATLDTVYKLPIISADPFGGTVLTDWYQLDNKSDTRFKLNVFIIGSELRSDAVRVTAFKQRKNKRGQWEDQAPSTQLGQEIESKILLKAREIKFNNA